MTVKLLVVGADAAVGRAAHALLPDAEYQWADAGDIGDVLQRLSTFHPDVVLLDLEHTGTDGEGLARQLRQAPERADAVLVVLAGADDFEHWIERLDEVADDVLQKPVAPVHLRARLRVHLAQQAERRRLAAEAAGLRTVLDQRMEELTHLLVQLIDESVPGAAERADAVAALCLQVAERFEIDPMFHPDLTMAARLHDIGQVLSPEVLRTKEGGLEIWRRAVVAQAILQQVEGLRPVAELLGCMYENWDGSGYPDHLQHGQIPLRSRILRTVFDYVTERAKPGATEAKVLEHLGNHLSTWYDPLVIAYLDAVLKSNREGPGLGHRRRVTVEALEVGMLLADDLTTSSGVKLMAAGNRITAAALESIRRRHEGDPIPHGVWIRSP